MAVFNTFRAKTPEMARLYKDEQFQYGGNAGGADEAANRYRQQGEAAQQRQGVGVDYAQANQARADQAQATGLMRARATGQAPSIAQMQADRQMQQAAAAQSSAAAGARGPAAIALAQQQQAANTANAQANISGQAQIAAAQERQQAEQAYFGAAGAMRGQDAQQSQFQAGLHDSQRGRNDQFQVGMTQAETGVRSNQLNAGMNQAQLSSANWNHAQDLNAQVEAQNAKATSDFVGGLIGAGTSTLGLVASDERVKTGVQPVGRIYGNAEDENSFQPTAFGEARDVVRAHDGAVDRARKRDQATLDSHAKMRAAGLDLTYEEQRDEQAAQGRLGLASKQEAKSTEAAKAPAKEGEEKKKLGAGDFLSAFGKGFGDSYAKSAGSGSGYHAPSYQAPQMLSAQAAPITWGNPHSDERTKVGVSDFAMPKQAASPMADAARAMRGFSYSYKPEFAQAEGQQPGEQNVGPMAQEMAKNPVTATAIKQDERGMLQIDLPKYTKVLGAVVADQQAQIDELKGGLSSRRKKG